MSKGQRGNKEAKKPKKVPLPDKSLVPVGTTPGVVAALPDRLKRRWPERPPRPHGGGGGGPGGSSWAGVYDGAMASIHETPDSRTLSFGASAIQSAMQLQAPDALLLPYTRTMMGFLLFHPLATRLAMIGLGGGSLLKFCHRHLPGTTLQVAEISAEVIALRDRFLIPPDSERLQVIQADGAMFVRDAAEPFDVLLVDGFDADGTPPSLCSQRFYDDCAAALQPDGLLVLNLQRQHPDHARHLDRLQRSFGPAGLCLVDETDGANTIAFAGHGTRIERPPLMRPRRPTGFDATAWASLQSALARVASAVRTAAA